MENKVRYKIFKATIRTAYPEGSIPVGLLNVSSLALSLQTAYGNCEVVHSVEDAPENPCPEHLYWDANNCIRCKQKEETNGTRSNTTT